MTKRSLHPPAFTLVELLVAGLLGLLALLTMLALYTHGFHSLRHTVVRLWAHQRARNTLQLLATRVRPAYAYELYEAYTPTLGFQVITGNYARFLLTDGSTTGFYRAGTTLYLVPNEARDNRASTSDDLPLLANVQVHPLFIGGPNQLRVIFRVMDTDATNVSLASVDCWLTLRNQ